MGTMTRKDPLLALMLEVLGGFFGILGIGWMYAGQIPLGVAILVAYIVVADTLSCALAILTAGLWCFVLPAQNLIFGALSGYLVYRRMQENG
jgi:hypothetical protein